MAVEMAGQFETDAPREQVWDLVLDPEVLARCIPGCERLERDGPNAYQATVVLSFGPVKARFRGRVEIEDLDRPSSCRLVGQGDGGVAGFAKGQAIVDLAPRDGGGTVLRYDARVEIGGKLAQLGNRLVKGTAQSLSAKFFDRLQKEASGVPA